MAVANYLNEEKRQYVMARQLLKSGTSIGANVEEAMGGQSRKDFFAKLSISYKEARETHYWLRLLKESKILESDKADLLINECTEILKIIGTIQTTMKRNR